MLPRMSPSNAPAPSERYETQSEDSAELRAYLQRGETRLSTSHRVAGSFISGAGLMTLLPLLISGTFTTLLVMLVFFPSTGLPEPTSPRRWLALLPVLASITLPIAALYLLIRDLIIFYFTSRTFKSRVQNSIVYPRFILSGIRVSDSSLSSSARRSIAAAREEEFVKDLMVPTPHTLRQRLLREAQRAGDLEDVRDADDDKVMQRALVDFVHASTGSDLRSLPEEAAKMEASLARHQRHLRSLVLRYGKAFLLTILSSICSIAAVGFLNLLRPIDDIQLDVNPALVWLATLTLYAFWSCAAAWLIRRPIAWLYYDTGDAAGHRTPVGLLQFERVTLVVASLCAILLTTLSLDLATPVGLAGAKAALSGVVILFCILTLWLTFDGFRTERGVR